MQEKEVNVLKVGISSTSIFKRIIWNKRFLLLQHWYGIDIQSSVLLLNVFVIQVFGWTYFESIKDINTSLLE